MIFMEVNTVATIKQMMMMDVTVVHVEVIESMWQRFMCSSYQKEADI